MLKTFQIIALTQGLFLLLILIKNRNTYRKVTFRLFIGSIISILLFIIGDDDNNLFVKDSDWFLFDSSLFITFLFLFFRYFKTEKKSFDRKDLWFFLPNVLYFSIELTELFTKWEHVLLEYTEKLVEAIFLMYLGYIILDLLRNKSKYWILYLTIPIVLHMGLNYYNELVYLAGHKEIAISDSTEYPSYFLVIIAFLFYGITFYLISKPKELLPTSKHIRYRNSNLGEQQIEEYKLALYEVMSDKKLYQDPKLSIHKLSQELAIPRQYISEVLNCHLGKNFQDFVNEYRVEAFVERLKKDQNDQFTLFGLANDVGFNSKSTFNAIFKKYKGLTPSQFKKSLYS